jgi:hypothetical protein
MIASSIFMGIGSDTPHNVDVLAKAYVASWTRLSEIAPIVTGHMSGGVYAKGIALSDVCSGEGTESYEKCYGVAFASPQSYGSTLSLVSSVSLRNRGSPYISNVYSDGSIFSMNELQTNQNVYFPSYQSYIKPATPYETFCLIAAGCVTDDRYDYLCSSAVGQDAYMGYFTKWGRYRCNLTSVGSPDNSMVPLAWSGSRDTSKI